MYVCESTCIYICYVVGARIKTCYRLSFCYGDSLDWKRERASERKKERQRERKKERKRASERKRGKEAVIERLSSFAMAYCNLKDQDSRNGICFNEWHDRLSFIRIPIYTCFPSMYISRLMNERKISVSINRTSSLKKTKKKHKKKKYHINTPQRQQQGSI